MKVEVWSDVVCPWCYVGARNLAAALEGFEHAGEVEVEWRSYELDPGAPAEREGNHVERISTKYGIPTGEARARIARIVSVGADAGIDFRFDHLRAGNTFDAHRLLHLAKEHGVQLALKDRLFAALFTEGLPVGDHDTLVKLAMEVGIPEADARRVLETDDHAGAVRADETEAMQLGVQGVPFFVIDRRYGVSGAQPPAVLREVLDRAWHDAHPIELVGGDADAGVCADDACEI